MHDVDPGQPEIERLIADAVEEARDGSLPPDRLESIQQILLTNQDARRFYLEYNRLSHLLTAAEIPLPDMAFETTHKTVPKTPAARSYFRPGVLAAAAVLALLAVYAIAIFSSGSHDEPARVIASLEQVDGNVTVTSVDAETRPTQPGTELRSGDTVRTGSGLSSAVVTYADGTRVLLLEKTSVTLADDQQKSVIVHSGTLSASVAPQPPNAPMLLVTPRDRVEVLGTKFVLQAKADETDVSVNHGLVRLTRLSDGQSVEVPAGRRVISSSDSELALQQIPAAPVDWSVDFESGLPAGWQTGTFVTNGLPDGSRGAVRADRLRQDGHDLFNIVGASQWAYGLFETHPDSHLNFTFKMDHPGWLDIIICTRTVEGDPPAFSSNYLFNDRGWWPQQSGTWATVSIPLSEFRRAAADQVPIEQVVPFSLVFSSPDGDRGLVIDRIWVTRGGPGVTQTKDLE